MGFLAIAAAHGLEFAEHVIQRDDGKPLVSIGAAMMLKDLLVFSMISMALKDAGKNLDEAIKTKGKSTVLCSMRALCLPAVLYVALPWPLHVRRQPFRPVAALALVRPPSIRSRSDCPHGRRGSASLMLWCCSVVVVILRP